MNVLELGGLIQSTDKVITYMREKKLLARTVKCCRQDCILMVDNGSDTEIFRCLRCRKKHSIRTGSFFEKSKLQLRYLLCILYFFANGACVVETAKYLKNMVSRVSIMQWFTYLREVCSLELLDRDEIILGRTPNSVVQIDECFFGGHLKYNRGNPNRLGQQQVIFGMIDTTTKKCMVQLVPNRTRATLLPLIRKHISQGAIIYSDEAAMYSCLRYMGYTHRTVKHKQEFKAADGTHTNVIESLWSHLKHLNKKRKGTSRTVMPIMLDEFLYRWNRKLDGDMFELFIEDISAHYRVS